MKETKAQKSHRLLISGRLRVFRVTADLIAAECKGDSGELYTLGWKDGRWGCSCAARTDCSHLNALWAVVAITREAATYDLQREV